MQTAEAYCKIIHGKIYRDSDEDCEFDSTLESVNINTLPVELRADGVPIDTFYYTGSDYWLDLNDYPYGVEYELVILESELGFASDCSVLFMLDTLSITNNKKDIGYKCTGSVNFDAYVNVYGLFRPVESSYIYIYPRVIYCDTVFPTNIHLTIPEGYTYTSASHTPTSISGSEITWDYLSWSVSSITVIVTAGGTVALGDIVTTIADISPTTGDVEPSNNIDTFITEVIAAFDPNNKISNPYKEFQAGDEIHYTINFENLGNDSAFNIHIIDTLSNNVIPETIIITGASHSYSYDVFEIGEYSVLRFEFPHILLPSAGYPNDNKGYISYKIKTKESLIEEDEVLNTAHIYFDVNPAVVTNTTRNVIPTPSSLPDISEDFTIKIYPNPTQDTVYIDPLGTSFENVIIVNSIGQSFGNYPLKKDANKIDISHLNAGVYYLIFQWENKFYTYKLTKY